MPGNPKECRAHALRCAELADSSTTPEARERLLELATKWNQLAAELEDTSALLMALSTIELEKTHSSVSE
jgi:hypothetical protein